MQLSDRFLMGKSTCEMTFSIEFISRVYENSDRYIFHFIITFSFFATICHPLALGVEGGKEDDWELSLEEHHPIALTIVVSIR